MRSFWQFSELMENDLGLFSNDNNHATAAAIAADDAMHDESRTLEYVRLLIRQGQDLFAKLRPIIRNVGYYDQRMYSITDDHVGFGYNFYHFLKGLQEIEQAETGGEVSDRFQGMNDRHERAAYMAERLHKWVFNQHGQFYGNLSKKFADNTKQENQQNAETLKGAMHWMEVAAERLYTMFLGRTNPDGFEKPGKDWYKHHTI